MDEHNLNPSQDNDLANEPDTPEDVAVLYTWANVHGGKYRDFSASRREFRAQQRHRVVEAQRQAELEAARAKEEAAARELEEARLAEDEVAQNAALRSEAEEARRRAELRASEERLAAQRHVETAEQLNRAAAQVQREIDQARRLAEEQAARYAEADARSRAMQQSILPGGIEDPYYYAGPLEPSAFAPGKGVRSSVPARFSSEKRITENYHRTRSRMGSHPNDEQALGVFSSRTRTRPSSGSRVIFRETAQRDFSRSDALETHIDIPQDEAERNRPDERERLFGGHEQSRYDDNPGDSYYDGVAQPVSEEFSRLSGLNSAQSDLHIPPRVQQTRSGRESLSGYAQEEDDTYQGAPPLASARTRESRSNIPRQENPRAEQLDALHASQEYGKPATGYTPALSSAAAAQDALRAQFASRVMPGDEARRAMVEPQSGPRIDPARSSAAKPGEAPPAESRYGERRLREARPEWLDPRFNNVPVPDAKRSPEREGVPSLNRVPPPGDTERRENRAPAAPAPDAVKVRAADGGFNLRPMLDRPPADRPPQREERKGERVPPAREERPPAGQPGRLSTVRGSRGEEPQLRPPDEDPRPAGAPEPAERRKYPRSAFPGLEPVGTDRQNRGPAPKPAATDQVRERANRPQPPAPPMPPEPRDETPAPGAQRNTPRNTSDTLQQSRERVALRWFALKGLMGSQPEPAPEPAQTPRGDVGTVPILAVVSLSGGVGKTSLVATLGRALSSVGEKVLLADTSTHGLLPYYFGARELRPDVVRTFSPPQESTDAPVYMVNYDTDRLIRDDAGQESLVGDIAQHSGGKQRVLLDLNSSSAWLARRLARTKPLIMVPVTPDLNSVLGIRAVERFFQGAVDGEGRAVAPYYVLNQFDASLPLHLDVREVLRQQLGDRLLPVMIRQSHAVAEALAEGMTVIDYAPDSSVTDDYIHLAEWIRNQAAPANNGVRRIRWSER